MGVVSLVEDLYKRLEGFDYKEDLPKSIDSSVLNYLEFARQSRKQAQEILSGLRKYLSEDTDTLLEALTTKDQKLKNLEIDLEKLNDSEINKKYKSCLSENEKLKKENIFLYNARKIGHDSKIIYKERIINRANDDDALELLINLENDFNNKIHLNSMKMFNVQTKLMEVEKLLFNIMKVREDKSLFRIMYIVKKCLQEME